MMDEFTDRVAVVTGAGSGIGQGIAREAARQGMRVVVADLEHGALEATTDELRASGADVLAVPTDVSDAGQVEALADAAYERFGAVHLLCNNAGVFQAGVVWQRTLADWNWVMGVNFNGVLHGIRTFVPRMIDGGEPGHIVNTSSMAGIMTVAFSGPYVVSKFAAAALTECLAHDFRAQGIEHLGVSCLVPGAVDTRIADSTRNRPDEPPSEAQAPDHWAVAGMLRDMTSNRGIHPDDAARIVFEGVRAGRFWICTSESFEPLVRQRYDAMLRAELAPGAQFD
jgi:NAD(P)-dependent dehydrogenase (short-subunit alcohol dehydrogenase family)